MLETPIAERHLIFSEKGKSERKPLVIRIFAPRPVDPASVSFQVAPGTAVCMVEFDGIPDETLGDTYGADSLQALQLAVRIGMLGDVAPGPHIVGGGKFLDAVFAEDLEDALVLQ